MTVRFACRCGKKMKASDEKIGTKVLCPECGSPVKIPESSTAQKETIATGVAASELAGNLLRSAGANKNQEASFGTQHDQISFNAPVKKPKRKFDIWGTLVDYSTTIIPVVVGFVLLVSGAYWLSSSMMLRKLKLPELASVEGVITLDGKPLANATIFFEAKDAVPGSEIATAMCRTDNKGHYDLKYLNDYDGGVVGPNKVRIQASDANGRALIAAQYAGQTELTANIVSGKENEFNFDLDPR